MVGYMITWTGYGTWLQGDKRGYVKDGDIIEGNEGLHKANTTRLKNPPTKLNGEHRKIVREAIISKGEKIGERIFAIAVCSNHVHIVAERTSDSIEQVVSTGKSWRAEFDTSKTMRIEPVSPQVHPEGN